MTERTDPSMDSPQTTPTRLDLKKDEKLEIDWADGLKSVYSLTLLRSMCPCAQCKLVREGADPHDISPAPKKKPLLTILPGNSTGKIKVLNAELAGNSPPRIDWPAATAAATSSFQ